ncbi:hypothetical protein AJ85_03965 [Alkalihalobacillus alcalophilus ATCC 27647 = CGMCC 1.3604]|uniref:Uncharacterized protein n=1 Tax=Alkalihalobacillus alcalophilus ATCC 27647 = CGMCC 1.3604 TaxID=1218173 RepID=A0A4S4K1W2_ALKAL|nr:hypothetical protein AJ85_03965 [Alkalihalobacillus alcalophilus ATCC 27647 = CGMCC 1.3604]
MKKRDFLIGTVILAELSHYKGIWEELSNVNISNFLVAFSNDYECRKNY